MGENNVWLAGRRAEQNAVHAIITEIEKNPAPADTTGRVRGAGTAARNDAITRRTQTP